MLIRQIRAMPPEQGGHILALALSAYAGEVNFLRNRRGAEDTERMRKYLTQE